MLNSQIIRLILDKYNRQQVIFKNMINYIMIFSILSAIIILLVGYYRSVDQFPWPKDYFPKYDDNKFTEGAIKYKNVNNIVLVDSVYLSNILDQLINSGSNTNNYSFDDRLYGALHEKIIIACEGRYYLISESIKKSINAKHQSNKEILDSLNIQLKKKRWLDETGSSLIERIQKNENILSSIESKYRRIDLVYNKDFPIYSAEYKYYIGKVKTIKNNSNEKIIISLENSAPILSNEFLLSNGLTKTNLSPIDTDKQKTILNELAKNDKMIYENKKMEFEKKIDSEISIKRIAYRKVFYERWYASLLLFINTSIFILLLIRYWIIIRQKKIPRKNTDYIYYATNRTSRLFRIIALIIVGISIIKLLCVVILNIFSDTTLFPTLEIVPYQLRIIFALLDPPITFIIALISSWLFILISEWIDFISNCYDIIFAKSHEKNN